MNAPRIAWVDVGKCIGIFLVVLGHCLPAGDPVKIMIYSFHVPFFFCLSGYIYNDSAEKGSFFLRVKNRFFRLIVPYAIYTLISLPVYFFNGGITTGELIKRIWFYEGRVI